jgi:hypothetical protein
MNQTIGTLICALLAALALPATGLLATPPPATKTTRPPMPTPTTTNQSSFRPPMTAPTNQPPASPASAWQPLFAEEAWYQQQPGQEQLFTGTLTALTPPAISTRMREPLYKLGNHAVFTRARKVPALDALVGQPIELRGKAVELNLEGKALREIWPAAIRRTPVAISP